MVADDPTQAGPLPSFSGLGGEQRFRTEVARATAGVDASGRWLVALPPLLRRLVDYDALWLGRLDDASGRYLPLIEDGAAESLHRLFADDVGAADVRRLGLRRPGWPMLGHRIAAQLAGLQGWRDYLAPAGFHDGLGVGLMTADDRHVGYLTLLTYRRETATAMAAALLHAVNPLLAGAVDRTTVPRAPD
ncbi:hypothetical protein [Microlunatus antarcticus]|uniref:Uncharacterized protein n=1 Tax=Microlunatus antarcticus TaxID=53388 RepID=A0A7W5JUZ3_9ACTN|nr:hypothetical protein [Microlunatus antarcticus]MBB3326546.1 hypothetical protein [Microlunatus antarcticus]